MKPDQVPKEFSSLWIAIIVLSLALGLNIAADLVFQRTVMELLK